MAIRDSGAGIPEEYKKDLVKQLWVLQSGYRNAAGKIFYYEYQTFLSHQDYSLTYFY